MYSQYIDRPNLPDVVRILPSLGQKYPSGFNWLEQRLNDISNRRARLLAICSGKTIFALAIETPKGHHNVKLSTFIVQSRWRRKGMGERLLCDLRKGWLDSGIDSAHVTVDQADVLTQDFFVRSCFVRDEATTIRYSEQRADLLFRWSANNDALAAAIH